MGNIPLDERTARAAGRIFDRHGVRAEWCRLKGSPDQPGLKRGFWHRVADFDSLTNLVTLDVNGKERTVPYSLLKPSRDLPEKATVFSPSTFVPRGTEIAEAVYVAVCPEGHKIGEVHPKEGIPLACADCHGREYDWEWERS